MRGRPPKEAKLRQRRNKIIGGATLPTVEASALREVPPIPPRDGGWHEKVIEWWAAMWTSPSAGEYTPADVQGGLYLLACHYQDFWTATTADERQKASNVLFKGWEKFGLSPIDRRRLQWEIEKGDQATERTQVRRQRTQAGGDPRKALKVV